MSANQTIVTTLEQVTTPIAHVVNTIGLLVGGVVGITVITFFVRLYFMRKLQKKIDTINTDIQYIKKQLKKGK